jgi:hypothetical protein
MCVVARIVLASLVALSPATAAHADQPRKAFVDSWLGRRVAVSRTLVTLVYNERGRFKKIHYGKREGLVVVTPSAGVYFQFDGRDSEQDIIARDPQQVMDRIGQLYQRDEPVDGGFFLRVEPRLLVRYERGAPLLVTSVRVDRDRVRMTFGSLAEDAIPGEIATALTIQWPTDLSPYLTEAPIIDGLIRQFVERVERGESR